MRQRERGERGEREERDGGGDGDRWDEEQLARVALLAVARLSGSAARRVVRRFGSAAEVWRRLGAEFPPRESALQGARRSLDSLAARGIRVLVPGRPGFPPWLAEIPDAPLLLYARGALPDGPALAVVGSRRATPRARAVAQQFCAALARQGVAIVSGLAYGVDAAAHRGAVEGGGVTLAVLASGIDRPSPAGNRALAAQILAAGGAWLSEHLPSATARPGHFPERNRVISGLAQATLVVEARERSGSLWTARHALEQGRDVLVVPGPIDGDACLGSNRLLRDGATPVLEVQDVLDAVCPRARSPRAGGLPGALEPSPPGAESALLARLADGPADVDQLARELALSLPELAALLLELELADRVERSGARVSLRRTNAVP